MSSITEGKKEAAKEDKSTTSELQSMAGGENNTLITAPTDTTSDTVDCPSDEEFIVWRKVNSFVFGPNNDKLQICSLKLEHELSQNVSEMTSSCSNINSTLQSLVEASNKIIATNREMLQWNKNMVDSYNKQCALMQQGLKQGFDKLVECVSRGHIVVPSVGASMGTVASGFDNHDDLLGEVHDGSMGVFIMRGDYTESEVVLPSCAKLFKDLGGSTRKTEDKNIPILLLNFLIVAAWTMFTENKQKLIFPFALDRSSDDDTVDYVKNWMNLLNCWTTGQDLSRKIGVVLVLVDSKPCLAIFHKKLDYDIESFKPKLTIVVPQSLKNCELPVEELSKLFEEIFEMEKEKYKVFETTSQKVFPADDLIDNLNSDIATGIKVRDFVLDFSGDKWSKSKNDFSHALFWLVTVFCSGTVDGNNPDELFPSMRCQLISAQENKDILAFRHAVCHAVYDCVIYLTTKGVTKVCNDSRGVPYTSEATTEELISELTKQKEMQDADDQKMRRKIDQDGFSGISPKKRKVLPAKGKVSKLKKQKHALAGNEK